MCRNKEISKGEDIIPQEGEEGSAPDGEGEYQMSVPLRGDYDEVGKFQLEGQRREEERLGVGSKGG